MKQEIDNNAMWAAFRQELSLQGELQVVAAIDNALNNLGFTIEETNTIIPIPLKQGEELTLKKVTKAFLEVLSETPYNNMPFVQAQASAQQLLAFLTDPKSYNPDSEVEPKFHEGEWVVWDNKITCHVDNIYQGKESLMYTITDINNMIRSCSAKSFDNNAHLWTIQDAKDGDVLCYEDEISIYKHDIKNCTKQGITFGGFVYYCCYDGKRFIMDGFYSLTEQDKTDIHPATKEQRDLLFQKIKEAGHEWNAEKKELKHIEQWKPSGE